MSDDNTNIEPVDLSSSRAELIERVKSRGRQIRARRRLAISGLAALVMVGIAAPAIALGSSSSSTPRPPAVTATPTVDAFRIAVVEHYYRDPNAASAVPNCVPSLDAKSCYVLGRTLVSGRDVRSAKVRRESSFGWIVVVRFTIDVSKRFATAVHRQAAIVVDGRVQMAPLINPGINGTAVEISRNGLTHVQAIALANAITGHVPVAKLSARVELPGDTFVAGSEVHGTLVVENDTGKVVTLPMDSNGCRIPWVVELTNYGSIIIDPPPIAEICLPHAVVLTPGTSDFSFTLITSYRTCTHSMPVGDQVACLPGANGGVPPLPAGDYTSVLQPEGVFPKPPPVTVHLIDHP